MSKTSRGFLVVGAVAAVVAIVQLVRLAVFMASPAHASHSTLPSSQWEVRHSCLTAYYVAGEAAARGQNIYDSALYSAGDDDPRAVRKPRVLETFNVDVYEYPPPFLLLMRLCRLVTADFLSLRPLWFALNLGLGLLAMWMAAGLLDPEARLRALLLAPLVWASLPTLSALQKGNVQLLVIAASMLAMVCFTRRWFAIGGLLLAYATVSKLYPGMLVFYLIARREWRPVFWTAGIGGALTLLSVADLGLGAYAGFLEHLPGLLGGEAFPAFRNPSAMAINYSVPGLVFKLKLFGVPGMGFPAAKALGWVWTLVILWLTVAAARRPLTDPEKPIVWMAILILATLRSPFLPQAYAAFPPLWLLTLLAARSAPTPRALALVAGAVLALNLYIPIDWGVAPRALALVTLVPQIVTALLAIVAIRPPARRASPAHVQGMSIAEISAAAADR